MTEKLPIYMGARLMTFKGGAGDEVENYELAVEVVDTADGVFEVSFDLERPKRRVYLRIPQADIRHALARAKDTPQ